MPWLAPTGEMSITLQAFRLFRQRLRDLCANHVPDAAASKLLKPVQN
jgi:hypothetical protein